MLSPEYKGSPHNGSKYLQMIHLLRDQYTEWRTKIQQRRKNPIQKGAKGCLDISPEKIQMAKKPVTRCSTSLVREMQITTTVRCHLTPSRKAIVNTCIRVYMCVCVCKNKIINGEDVK